jgi:hypothetical protein
MKPHTLLVAWIVIQSAACTNLPLDVDGFPLPTPAQAVVEIPSGAILFQDDFSSPTTGWERMLAGEGVMDYDGGGFRILVNALDTNFWSTPGLSFDDVRLEVDVGKLGGPDENRIGMICRLSEGNYYFFLVTSDGYSGIGLFNLGQAILLGQTELQFNERILQGMTVNHLRADCQADQLAMYVNGFESLTVHDQTLASGEIGLMAGTFSEAGVDVIFDNFVALQP